MSYQTLKKQYLDYLLDVKGLPSGESRNKHKKILSDFLQEVRDKEGQSMVDKLTNAPQSNQKPKEKPPTEFIVCGICELEINKKKIVKHLKKRHHLLQETAEKLSKRFYSPLPQ